MKKNKEIELPEEKTIKANLEFISYVFILARRLANDKAPHQQIADLMDVVHNLPEGLWQWQEWDQSYFLSWLEKYDEKWPVTLEHNKLLNIYKKFARLSEV